MNSIDIYHAMKSNSFTKNKFKGVFACDKLPRKIVSKSSFYIGNTDPSNKPGQHWIVFYFPKNKPAEYFCSAGQPPIKPFVSFLSRNSKSYICNKKRIQNEFSIYCGLYCCIFVYFRSRNIPFYTILNFFNYSNLFLNDVLVLTIFKNIFKKM